MSAAAPGSPASDAGSDSSVGSSASAAAASGASQATQQEIERADELKTQGNTFFKDKQYSAAIKAYTEALDLHTTAVLYGNRAFAHLKLENFGSAIADADAAIRVDPDYLKAYYRKGSASLALGNFADAKDAFFRVAKARPQDRDARSKLAQCNKIIKQQKFKSALASGDRAAAAAAPSNSWRNVDLPSDYSGPKWDDDSPCDEEFMKAVMKHFKAQKMLPRRYVMRLLSEVKALLRGESTLVEAKLPAQSDAADAEERYFNICGDTHGQYYDLLHIFELNGLPSAENPYLFNGDFVDRGSFGVENVLVLLGWKLALPAAMHLNRGNHETINMNKMYGFDGEVNHKLDEACMGLFTQVFQSLPLVHVVDSKVMVVHGGLPSTDESDLAAIKRIDRFKEPPEGSLFADLLWTDPQPFQGRGPSKRGQGKSFGPDITRRFLEKNGLQLLVRSHEVRDDGYLVEHNGKCITVFSAPNYCDSMGNKGGIVRLDRHCTPSYVQFSEVEHPPVRPMQYSNNIMQLMGLM